MDDWKSQINLEDLDEPYYTIAKEFGLEIAFGIIELFQGSQVYFPQLERHCNNKVRELIVEEFDGYNFDYLAKKYGYTVRWVRKICQDKTEKERNKPLVNQMSLFDLE